MTLIKSISGIRGTIGGKSGEGLTPIDIVKFTSAFANFIKNKNTKNNYSFVVGRDARISGEMVNSLVIGTLRGMGFNVIDIGLTTTPTTEMAVLDLKADGGIIITASHNPKQWNALKLLNHKGEFINADDGLEVLKIAENENIIFASVNNIGQYYLDDKQIDNHIEKIINLPLVDSETIKKANFKIAIDCVNSTGAIALPKLLKALGVNEVIELYCITDGNFPHNPEPLPENLTEISKVVSEKGANLGFVVDPDVDRLAIVDENGEMFGEEYTLVAVADYILKNQKGNTVSNLSSTKALKDITEKYGVKHYASAVGEVNVVEMMKNVNAIIGGEGNGGVIYPELHYGRDALVGIALFLSFLAKENISCSELKKHYPEYYISKNKIELSESTNVDIILEEVAKRFSNFQINKTDGVKIVLENEWIHLRKSNTEPIIRIYTESNTTENAETLAKNIINVIKEINL